MIHQVYNKIGAFAPCVDSEWLKTDDKCPDCDEILVDSPEYHSLWCQGRDSYDIEVVDGDDGLKRVILHRKVANEKA